MSVDVFPPIAGSGYSDEQAQDAVGTMLVNTATIDLTYTDATPSITADVKNASITEGKLSFSDVTTLDASTTTHGLLRKLSGTATQYLNGTGAWTTPPTPTLPLAIVEGGTGATTAAQARTALELGTLATQNANAVAITGGSISIGGHAPTGVLDVQGSVVDPAVANYYVGVRVWPVAPSGALYMQAIKVEPTTGPAADTIEWRGLLIRDQPANANIAGVQSAISAGTGRYNLQITGTAQNYFAGNVGIANATPSYPLDVTGQVRMTGQLQIGAGTFPVTEQCKIAFNRSVSANGLGLYGFGADTGGLHVGLFNAAGTLVGSITTTATATAYNTSSDVRLKHAITPLTDTLASLRAVRPVSHRWNADDSLGEGFLAHELMGPFPLAVTGQPDEVNADGSIKPQQVDHSKMIPRMTAWIQELLAKVDTLEAQMAARQ